MSSKWPVREKGVHKIEVHVAGFVLREQLDGTVHVLIGKRTPTRMIFPGKWECGGGQVHEGEDFPRAIKFHMKEEFGVDVIVLFPVTTYEIQTQDGSIPGLRFVCSMQNESQAADANPEEFDECRWISEMELDEYDLIPGLADHAREAIAVYRRLGPSRRSSGQASG